jgi:hypothetical protein
LDIALDIGCPPSFLRIETIRTLLVKPQQCEKQRYCCAHARTLARDRPKENPDKTGIASEKSVTGISLDGKTGMDKVKRQEVSRSPKEKQ